MKKSLFRPEFVAVPALQKGYSGSAGCFLLHVP